MIYYIACSSTMRVKIGYTGKDVDARLRALQTGSAAPLRLIAVHVGDKAEEARLHEKFAAHRVHGEWFEICEELFDHICSVVWVSAAWFREHEEPIPEWVAVGLRMMNDMVPLPEEMAALI